MKVLKSINLKIIKDNILILLFVILGVFFFTIIAGMSTLKYFRNYKEGIDIISTSANTEVIHPVSTSTSTDSGSSSSESGGSGSGSSSSGSSGSSTEINKDMSIYLPFDKTDIKDTTIANKYDGNNNYTVKMVGTPTIITTDSKVGSSCLSLNGSSYLTLDNFSVTTQGFSTSFWTKNTISDEIRKTFSWPGWMRVFCFGNGAGNDNILFAVENGPSVQNLIDGKVVWYQPRDSEKILDGPWKMNDGKWNHMVWTCTYAPPSSYTSTWQLYLNNKLVYTTYKGLYPTTTTNRTKNYIGYSNWGTVDPMYTGLIDDFRTYNKVLTVEDVGVLYNKFNKI